MEPSVKFVLAIIDLPKLFFEYFPYNLTSVFNENDEPSETDKPRINQVYPVKLGSLVYRSDMSDTTKVIQGDCCDPALKG